MSVRVALRATLIMLTLLIVSALVLCAGMAGADNGNQSALLRSSCTNIGGLLENISDEELRGTTLKSFTTETWSIGLYTSEGDAAYKSKRVMEALSEEDKNHAQTGEAVSYTRKGTQTGAKTLYAIYRLTDGGFLRISAEAAGIRSALSEQLPILICILVVLSAVTFVTVLSVVSKREHLQEQILQALNEFATGNYAARIPTESLSEEDVMKFNAPLARVDERITRQNSRNQALSVIMNQMQNGMLAVDQDLRVMLVTPVAKKLLGIVGNAEGMLITEASNSVKLDDVFGEAMRQGGVYTNDVVARTTAGREHRPLRLYVSPMHRDGKVVGALAMVEDITELRRLERVRVDFASNVSHELKTPLTSIRGFVETLEAGAIDNPQMAHKFLRIIMLETERLTRLINDILSISKLESGTDEVNIQRIRVDKMAYEITDMLSIHANEKNVELSAHMNATPVYIDGNPDRVEQMLINLIENAIKYNKPEGGKVTVQVSTDGQNAHISIADTGIGIAEENLPRLFERFYRVDKGRSRSMGGTGLGLAIVKHIVQSMNGDIEVQSKFGEGTEFLLTIPISKNTAPEVETPEDDDFE